MTATLTAKACAFITERMADDKSDDNPFVREGGKTYLKHDQITISRRHDGMIEVAFGYRGKTTYTWAEVSEIYGGGSITIEGVEGRMQVSVTA